jgi:hypothetical protein
VLALDLLEEDEVGVELLICSMIRAVPLWLWRVLYETKRSGRSGTPQIADAGGGEPASRAVTRIASQNPPPKSSRNAKKRRVGRRGILIDLGPL